MKCALKHIYLEVEAEPKYFEMKKYTGEYRSLEIKYKLLSSFEDTYCTVLITYCTVLIQEHTLGFGSS